MTEEDKENKEFLEDFKPSHFSFKRVFLITRRVLRQISRDRRTFGMIIIMPIVTILIFGFALGGDIKNIPILVDNEDKGYTTIVPPGVNVTFSFGTNITNALKSDDRVHYNTGNFFDNKKNKCHNITLYRCYQTYDKSYGFGCFTESYAISSWNQRNNNYATICFWRS
ncbi:MAG: hypothetical protein P8Y70_01010 [Candidatus Lokiarchaeota archaeon]